ncbi:PSD1 and planctomycete cytochrome C domain-containing protein [Humisphaera borealis]|uniref:PSD1 domain-containing protein n=1 Tax=Humisphaera borealis TaxID=2807512 RepID=A0A7M2X3N6_9BACT|nr:PSD1 and planctomycete cytochrome C domain-containing protein [Humisphaera borealis]QOV91380.1 PSD1 domain-containing protein [Humisphaera borealis]
MNRTLQSRLVVRLAIVALFSGLFEVGSTAGTATSGNVAVPETVQFNRDVRPILSDNCYFCHGFDKNKRKADLRLDTQDGQRTKRDEGTPIVPGKPADSLLIQKIISKDPDEVMPPADHPKRLSERDIAVLTKWVEQGATFEGHWAYIAPKRPATPEIRSDFVRTPIDAFIAQRLQAEGLPTSPEADRTTLIRRLTFDLTGLPPSVAEVQAFVDDRSPQAYENVVDRLLASPRFGERMAMYWLDLVRYADTIGYHSDNPMNVSPYREWVVHAFNANMPFDRFTVAQLAGDLLPNATIEQKVASGYNRLLQTTEEGGAQAKEYLVKNLTDRVRNYSTVWLGQTVGCAQCHDHKFDPIGTKDFYTMGAFFADVQEAPIGRREAGMPVPSPQQQTELNRLDAAIAAAKAKMSESTPALVVGQAEWEKKLEGDVAAVGWTTLTPTDVKSGRTALFEPATGIVRIQRAKTAFPKNDTYVVTAAIPAGGITAIRLEAMTDESFPANGPGLAPNGNFVLTEVTASIVDPKKDKKDRKNATRDLKLVRASADHSQDTFPIAHAIDGKKDTGWAVLPETGKPHEAVLEFEKPVIAAAGEQLIVTLDFASVFPQHQIGKFCLSATTNPAPAGLKSVPPAVTKVLEVAEAKRSPQQKAAIAEYYRSIAPELAGLRTEIADMERQKADMLKTVPTCLVSTAGAPRTVRILDRGNWQDEAGPEVQPAIPEVLGKLPVEGRRATRLDLAEWTVRKDNPLTSRVFVNRAWKLFFGQGLSKVLDDIGFQGEWPTHPELLDWLAVDFAENGWDIKRFIRQLVTSSTYRQSSVATAVMKEKDPYNRLYARQSRFRIDAEMVRDNALAVSGMLVEKIGGKSVFPYQPRGYWFALNFPTREWQNDTGDGLYRRGLYTHWQRSFPHPSLLAFDAPSREEATCERARSNIPQQALVLLNDPTYVEAARVLASKVVAQPGDEIAKLNWGFTQATSRKPTAEELGVFVELLGKHRAEYAADTEAAKQLLSIGSAALPAEVVASELAAWTSVTRVMLNLSEVITRY